MSTYLRSLAAEKIGDDNLTNRLNALSQIEEEKRRENNRKRKRKQDMDYLFSRL